MRSTSEGGSKDRRKFTDELRPEYSFDYAKAKPNRFAGKARKEVVVVLDADVARLFKDAASVNNALRALMSAMPQRRTKG